jgi:hypothetical protein
MVFAADASRQLLAPLWYHTNDITTPVPVRVYNGAMTAERVVLNVRLPADLHAEVKRIAEREDRSLNAQIIRFLREGAERYEAHRPKSESAE